MDVHLRVPRLFGRLHEERATAYARVVHEYIELAVGIDRELDGGFPVGFAGDVVAREYGVVALLAELRCGALALLFEDVGEHDLRALPGEQPSRRAAEAHDVALHACRRARYQRYFSFETHFLFLSLTDIDIQDKRMDTWSCPPLILHIPQFDVSP